jgi:hypothetical protein
VSRRSCTLLSVLALTCALVTAAPAVADAWRVVKKGQTAGAGQLALVGDIVKRPGVVAIRAVVTERRSIAVAVVMSCRRGLTTRVGTARLTGVAPFTKAVPLPLAGASNCAVSATATNPAGQLTLVLLRR